MASREDILSAAQNLSDMVAKMQGLEADKQRLREMIRRIASCGNDSYAWELLSVGMRYSDYLKTSHWARVSDRAKRLWRFKCALCNSKGELHAHHRTYLSIGNEMDADVICLCRECHEHFHSGRQAEGQKPPREVAKASRPAVEKKTRKALSEKQPDSTAAEPEVLIASDVMYEGVSEEERARAKAVYDAALRRLADFSADVGVNYSEVRVTKDKKIHVVMPDAYAVQLMNRKERRDRVSDCFSQIYGSKTEVEFIKG